MGTHRRNIFNELLDRILVLELRATALWTGTEFDLEGLIDLLRLVHRLANNGDVAGGQLAVFQGASEAPISESYGSSEQRGKTANWPRPGGLR